jgi:hypothetical protein
MKWSEVIKILKIQIRIIDDWGGPTGYTRVSIRIPSMIKTMYFTYSKDLLVGNPHFFIYQQITKSYELEKWMGEKIEFCYENEINYLYKK